MATIGKVDFMNHRHLSIDVVPAILPLVLVACPLAAAEFRPVAVRTDAECSAAISRTVDVGVTASLVP